MCILNLKNDAFVHDSLSHFDGGPTMVKITIKDLDLISIEKVV